MSRIASTFRRLLEQGGWYRPLTPLAIAICLGAAAVAYHHAGTGSEACAQTTANIPDGPDPWGGCWPGPSNTGPDAPQGSMSAYSGPCSITTPNVTIDSKVITCDITVGSGASGLVISNSYLIGSTVQQTGGSTASFTVQDSYIDGTLAGGFSCDECDIRDHNFTVLRTEILSTNRAIYCGNNCHVEDNYIHTAENLDPASGLHASGMRPEQYSTVIHNTIGCMFTGPYTNPDTGCSADTTGYPDFQVIYHNTLDRNLFLGGEEDNNIGFCTYGGASTGKPFSNDPDNATYQVWTNNVFQRGFSGVCGGFGPVTDFETGNTGNVWSNNTYDDGTVINP